MLASDGFRNPIGLTLNSSHAFLVSNAWGGIPNSKLWENVHGYVTCHTNLAGRLFMFWNYLYNLSQTLHTHTKTTDSTKISDAIIKPIWSYGIQLWGCAKPSDTQIIQRIQSKTLRIVFNAPWYVSNKTLRKDSRIPFVEDKIIRMTNRYILNLTGHSNEQVNQLHLPPPEARRRLHRQWPTDVLQ